MTTTENPVKKKIKRKPMHYCVARVVRNGDATSYEVLPMPEDTDTSSRERIKASLARAIKSGDTTYENDELVILSYKDTFRFKVETSRSVSIK